jgi:hypothetical protein
MSCIAVVIDRRGAMGEQRIKVYFNGRRTIFYQEPFRVNDMKLSPTPTISVMDMSSTCKSMTLTTNQCLTPSHSPITLPSQFCGISSRSKGGQS